MRFIYYYYYFFLPLWSLFVPGLSKKQVIDLVWPYSFLICWYITTHYSMVIILHFQAQRNA